MRRAPEKGGAMKKFIVFLCAALIGTGAGFVFGSAFAVTEVSDDAMAPALIKGDHVVLDLFVTGEKTLQRGDIIEIENPLYAETGEDSRMLKRIVGLPGETVAISDGFIWIDGAPQTEEPFDGIRIGNTAMTARVVPEDCYFVLGDNLPDSTDSRHVTVGMIKEKDILGKVILEW